MIVISTPTIAQQRHSRLDCKQEQCDILGVAGWGVRAAWIRVSVAATYDQVVIILPPLGNRCLRYDDVNNTVEHSMSAQ